MNTYLAIITTVLVLSQIIRVAQNAIQLHRQNTLFNKQFEELVKFDLTKKDMEKQKMFYSLGIDYFNMELRRYHEEHPEYQEQPSEEDRIIEWVSYTDSL